MFIFNAGYEHNPIYLYHNQSTLTLKRFFLPTSHKYKKSVACLRVNLNVT